MAEYGKIQQVKDESRCSEFWSPRGSEHANPKYATFAYWLFWAEGTWEMEDSGRAFRPPPSYLKQIIKFPIRKVLYWEEESHHQRQGIKDKTDLYKQTYQNNP